MKTTRFLLLHYIVLLATIISVIGCIGCAGFIDDILNDTGVPSSTDSDIGDNQSIIADILSKR